MSWTDERVERLTQMWGEGLSASQIAKELGGVTRNAVIGKVHRLGLSNRAGGAAGAAAPTPEPAAEAPPVAEPEVVAPEPAAPEPVMEAAPETDPEPLVEAAPDLPEAAPVEPEPEEEEAVAVPVMFNRRPIVPAGQPLPPQPSANEVSAEALATVREVEKKARRLSLLELTERTCKWPVGDPATEDFWFCGLPTKPGKPYCEAHVGVAFQPMSSRRDRRR